MENSTGQKKVWTGSERVMGYIVALAIFGAIGYGLYYILPFLITLVTNVIIFGALVIGTGLLCWGVWANRKMISTAYQIIIKKIWKAMINSNPIAIMEIQYDTWLKQHEKLGLNINTLRASEEELLAIMEENKDFAQEKFKIAQMAKEINEKGEKTGQNYGNQATKNAILAQRRVESNKMFLPKLEAIRTALNYCERVYSAWTDDLELLKDDINEKKRNLKVLSRTNGVFEMAKSYINGNSNERIMFDEANEAYAERISMYVANIKGFVAQSKDWVYNKDIQDAIATEEGQKFLSMYDETSFNQLTDFRSLMSNNDVTFVQSAENMEKMETATFTRTSKVFDGLK